MIMQSYCSEMVVDPRFPGRNYATGNIPPKQETCGKPPDTVLLTARYVLHTRLDTQAIVVLTHTLILIWKTPTNETPNLMKVPAQRFSQFAQDFYKRKRRSLFQK